MKEKKKQLRKLIAGRKAKIPGSTLKELSTGILETLEQHPVFQFAQTILLYYSMKDEVHTHDFIEKWSGQKRILLPAVIGEELELRLYSTPDDLAVGAYNIKEPIGEVFHDYSAIDLAIIPGVAFDRQGYRLGRGKGYYDRLLPEVAAYKVGICFPFQVVEEIPTEAFDIRMDEVISV